MPRSDTLKEVFVRSPRTISGEVREAIVFDRGTGAPEGTAEVDDIFAEMHAFMVDVQDVNDSREAIYSRMEGE